mmetsp:Transcript_157705/g.294151  ORF Transcript_157705/g.294151 Transcript_157705/m.294151 type:complete len:290 (-) Transcript_157705:132-1001(-)
MCFSGQNTSARKLSHVASSLFKPGDHACGFSSRGQEVNVFFDSERRDAASGPLTEVEEQSRAPQRENGNNAAEADVSTANEQSERRSEQKCTDELTTLWTQLRAARDAAARLQEQLAVRDSELKSSQGQLRKEAERHAAAAAEHEQEKKRLREENAILRRELQSGAAMPKSSKEREEVLKRENLLLKTQRDHLGKENQMLRHQVKLLGARQPSVQNAAWGKQGKAGDHDLAKRVAEVEAAPLKRSSEGDRAVLRRKLLLKWHPDKQPSTEHAELATRVMQELQQRPDWN